FLIKGYKNVNLDNISKELRISKRTIYNIFTSKKHLFSECCLTIFLGLTDIAVPILNNTNLTPFEKITKIIRTFIPQISRIPPSFLNDMRLYTPALYQDFLSFREFMLLRYQGIIKSAQKAGFVRNDINTEILTDILLLSANNILIPEYLMAKNISPSEGLGHILKIIFLGILSEDARIQIKEI
ncbi:MAG: TetR/AcrR family transcriptional regulator, partial [Deltaproteobacteria bacterium]|nr:TetR/AcrR family transcriptional regulator [Deltaproteobacteria bacterium]